MPTRNRTKCAVRACTVPLLGLPNLCDSHMLPGGVVLVDDGSTFVITAWYAERAGETGVILINDFALGDLFAGRVGFESELAKQGFTGVRLLLTREELELTKTLQPGKKAGNWAGPWLPRYPWESE